MQNKRNILIYNKYLNFEYKYIFYSLVKHLKVYKVLKFNLPKVVYFRM